MCPWPWHRPSWGACGGQPCPGAMPGRVCAVGPGGRSGAFSPSFLFPLLYVTAQIFGLSQLQGGVCVSALLLGGAGALLCTLRVLLGAGRVGRGARMLRPPTLAALVSTGQGWPGRCQPRQWGPPASLLGGSRGRIQPLRAPWWWEAGFGLDGDSGSGSLPCFPPIFSFPGPLCMPPWPPLLGPALGRALGPRGPSAPSKGWHQCQNSQV